MNKDIQKRYDFLMFFDVKDGNPNGDPDAGNLPRIDAETGHGLITDVCLKRKIRNYVGLKNDDQPPYGIFIKEKAILNNLIMQAYIGLDIDLNKAPSDPTDGTKRNKVGQGQGKEVDRAKKFMCQNFFDIRTFGAVLSTGAMLDKYVAGAVHVCPFGRSDCLVGTQHYPNGRSHRSGSGEAGWGQSDHGA